MDKKKKPTNNGIEALPDEVEMLRQQVIRSEFRARLWKADYETAYYSLELDKLGPAYQTLIEKQRAEHAEREEKYKKIIEEMRKNSVGDSPLILNSDGVPAQLEVTENIE